jgi:2-polyprenyl-6-methoxyphenol hydroxylase-like FAD-dependent oxidoreductase
VTCPAGIDCWTLFAGASAMLLLVPIGQGRAYCFAALNGGQQVTQPMTIEQFRGMFAHFVAPVREVVGGVDQMRLLYASPIDELRAPVWGSGRTVLIGDAAHGMSPAMAQGAALAVEDALTLAALLRNDTDWSSAPERLAAARDRRVAWVMRHTSRQARMLQLPYPLRRRALRLVGERVWRRSFAPLRAPI